MLAANLDAHTQATIEDGTTSVKLALNGLRVETKISLSGRTEARWPTLYFWWRKLPEHG